MTERLVDILYPYGAKRIAEVAANNRRFVHYTSAGAAMDILTSETVWMRNAVSMNDFSEVTHGWGCLRYALRSPSGTAFESALDAVYPGIAAETKRRLDHWGPSLQAQSYILSLSEHRGGDEDKLGRLSMWRAYGQTAGVALVMNNRAMLSESNALSAFSSPVAYFDQERFAAEMAVVAANVQANVEVLKTIDYERLIDEVFHVLRMGIFCTKHPGFAEEAEWRVIYTPRFDQSTRIKWTMERVNGTPQRICKIPLKDEPEEGLEGLAIPSLIERIIIGPTKDQWIIADAFHELFRERGYDPAPQVIISQIPLRT